MPTYGETASFFFRLQRNEWGVYCVFAYGQKDPRFFFRPHIFFREKSAAPKNGGVVSRTVTPAHGALSGIIVKKARQRTAARPKYNPSCKQTPQRGTTIQHKNINALERQFNRAFSCFPLFPRRNMRLLQRSSGNYYSCKEADIQANKKDRHVVRQTVN